ncbi:MAG: outer membrane lipoprotein carrier protein LolA [Labilithrix sp.]|nr:outer membrane lipoprotein carrier protein LolA [Labilithrix sp.]MCW5812389.1 outer membrane lipoprotein carrier protein LolA [Labilithrix sp.]
MARTASFVAALALAAVAALTSPADAQQAAPAPAPAPAPPAPQPAPQATTDATVAKVQAFYDGTTSFSSPFTQQFFVKSHNITKDSKGKVLFSKPGKMAWDYETPAGNRVVSDGTILKVYEAANKQLFEQAIDKSQYPAALSFLTGTGKLADAFSFVMYDGAAMQFPGGQVLVGSPKKETAAYTKVLFYVDASTFHVRRALIVDAQGNRNRFDFTEPKVNIPIPPDAFTLVPPPGTQVIKP